MKNNPMPKIKAILEKYVKNLKSIDVETDEEFNALVKAYKKAMLDGIINLRDENPMSLFCNYSEKMSEKDAKALISVIQACAEQKYDLSTIPCLEYFVDTIQNNKIVTPSYISSLSGYDAIPVGGASNVKQDVNQFLLTLLLMLPIKKVKFTFVDFGGSFLADFFLKEINPTIYNTKPITDTYAFKEYLKNMKDKVIKNVQQYGDVCKYNAKNKTIVEPYEVIVLLDNADKGSSKYLHDYETELEALKRNCAAGGVFIIDFLKIGNEKEIGDVDVLLKSSSKKLELVKYIKSHWGLSLIESKDIVDSLPYLIVENIPYKDALKYKDELEKIGTEVSLQINGKEVKLMSTQKIKGLSNALISPSFIEEIPAFKKACIDYINSEAAKEEETQIVSMQVDKLEEVDFEPINDTLLIPVGKKGFDDVSFRMDIVSHVHAFILGQSGSGKSVFLHDVISGAMLKYSPEDLELYLLDFKLGGVEFNRYRGEKHVHAMLVDNSDPQITLEILRELRDRMAERGKTLRQAGLTNIKEYNEQHPENKMKHILFIADECHEMFRVDDNNRAISNEISDVIVKIAKEGRNQGVHLLLATQTLANTDISNEILNNISDHYLLKCAIADSEKMVSKSSDITSKLTTGKVYYHHVDDNYVFQAFYADKKQAADIIQAVNKKTKSLASNETFYFSGASVFHFEPSTAIQEHTRKCRKMPVAFAGKSIDLKQVDMAIPLNEDFSENILLLGLNDECQSTRVSMNLLVSLLATNKSREADVEFKVIDCLSDNDKYVEVLDELENAGLVDVIPAKKRAPQFKQLAEEVLAGKAKETILFILGQDRFRELKLDLEFEEESSANDDSELTSIISFGSESSSKKTVKSFSEAMNVILDKGPEVGVHTIIQLEKTANYLFTDYISHKELFQKFKHLILLKSDENAATQLHLRNDIRLENLSKEEERLRAYYYAEESDTYTLFTPYMPLEGKDLKEFIKTL